MVGDKMNYNILSTVLTAGAGFIIAFLNYMLSKTVILKSPDKYSVITVLRQIIQIGFLVAVYFVGKKFEAVNITYLLIGAVVGMTVPMLFFTKKLLSVNDSIKNVKNREEDENG